MRPLGAVAIRLRSSSAQKWASLRRLSDLDFFAYSEQRAPVEKLLTDMGLTPRTTFNMLHGQKRLMFYDEENKVVVDVFFDKFDMCHVFDFRGRLELDKMTLPLADLLMTKLQIVHLNEKDVRDIIYLLSDHGLTSDDKNPDLINIDRISRMCSEDWGIYKTFRMNIDKVEKLLEMGIVEKEVCPTAQSKLGRIREVIESREKSLRWKLRARIGERMIWYTDLDAQQIPPTSNP